MASSDDVGEACLKPSQQFHSMRSSAGGQHDDDDPIETVDRSVDKLETLVQHLRKASDNFSSERLSREKDREELHTKLAEAEDEARRNRRHVDDLSQQLQDTERAVKDKDTLCSTLAQEIERLRKLLIQLDVDPHRNNQDSSVEEVYESTPLKQTSNTLPLLSQTTAHCLSVEDSLSSIVSRAGLILEQEEGESSPNLLEAEEQREQRRLHDLAKSLYLNLQRALEVNKKWKVDYNQIKEDKDRVIANLENKVQLLKEQLVAATKRDNTAEEKRWDLSKRSESHHKRLDQPVHQKSKQNSRKPRDDSELEKAPEMMKLQHEVEYLRRELHDAKRKLNQINSGIQDLMLDPQGDEDEVTCNCPHERNFDQRTVKATENWRQAMIVTELELPSDVTVDTEA